MAEQKYTKRVIEAVNKASEYTQDERLAELDIPALLKAIYQQDESRLLQMSSRFFCF